MGGWDQVSTRVDARTPSSSPTMRAARERCRRDMTIRLLLLLKLMVIIDGSGTRPSPASPQLCDVGAASSGAPPRPCILSFDLCDLCDSRGRTLGRGGISLQSGISPRQSRKVAHARLPRGSQPRVLGNYGGQQQLWDGLQQPPGLRHGSGLAPPTRGERKLFRLQPLQVTVLQLVRCTGRASCIICCAAAARDTGCTLCGTAVCGTTGRSVSASTIPAAALRCSSTASPTKSTAAHAPAAAAHGAAAARAVHPCSV